MKKKCEKALKKMEIITAISLIIVCGTMSFLGAMFGFKNVKFKIQQDISQPNTFTITPNTQNKGKVEFFPDATEDELEEMAKEPKWRKFLSGFKKA